MKSTTAPYANLSITLEKPPAKINILEFKATPLVFFAKKSRKAKRKQRTVKAT